MNEPRPQTYEAYCERCGLRFRIQTLDVEMTREVLRQILDFKDREKGIKCEHPHPTLTKVERTLYPQQPAEQKG